MKIKITDLLDTYYDDSVKFNTARKSSEQTEPTPISTAKKHSFKKPLTAVACFILLICGTSLLGLRFLGGNQGASLSQPEAPEIPMMDASFVDESLMEPEETQDSPEYNPEVNTHTVYTAHLDIPIDGLSLGLESDGEDYLSLLTIDPVSQTFRWSAHLPGLEALRWETYPEDGRNSFDDETYTEAFFSWVTYMDENICRDAVLRFADGSELTLYVGESFGFDSNLLNMEGPFDVLEYEQAIPVADYNPVELSLNGVSYEFTPAEIEDAPVDPPDLTGEETVSINATVEETVSINTTEEEYLADPDTHYDPAQDTDGDGYLTAWLTYDTAAGTVVKLQLDVSTNSFAWYIHNEELFDAYVAYEAGTGDWDTFETLHVEVINDLLENYFKTAYIVFTDGTKVPVGGGDAFRLEDDLIREESIVALTSTTQDYYPAYLEFDGVRYEFE